MTIVQINNANPIPVPTIEISELYFDASGEWTLELGYYGVTLLPVDSIRKEISRIVSKNGSLNTKVSEIINGGNRPRIQKLTQAVFSS